MVPPTVPAPPPAPTDAPTPDPGRPILELRGDDLAATTIGDAREGAVAAVSAVLGAPSSDPAVDVACVHALSEVAWPSFRLAFNASGLVSGWVSRSPELRTPSGVRVGTTVATLRQVYGEKLTLHPANPDNPESYTVQGVQMVGYLNGADSASEVVALANGECTGP